MERKLCSHVSVHFLRFASAKTVGELGRLENPDGAARWIPMVDVDLSENVLAERVGSDWAVVGLHASGEEADSAVARSGHFSSLTDDITEYWRAAFDVISHHGVADWIDRSKPGLILEPVAEDRGGPLAVMTTAGFVLDANFDLARAQDFASNSFRALKAMEVAPGNVFAHVLSGAEVIGHDAITFTVWQGDTAMRAAAYKKGQHREQVDRHRASPMVDRSSFTRLRTRTSAGSRNGVDPIEVAAAV